jgi:hypothetical protein
MTTDEELLLGCVPLEDLPKYLVWPEVSTFEKYLLFIWDNGEHHCELELEQVRDYDTRVHTSLAELLTHYEGYWFYRNRTTGFIKGEEYTLREPLGSFWFKTLTLFCKEP